MLGLAPIVDTVSLPSNVKSLQPVCINLNIRRRNLNRLMRIYIGQVELLPCVWGTPNSVSFYHL